MALDIAAEVKDALAAGGAVVALESTIIAHGMPYPQNLETAQALEISDATVKREWATARTWLYQELS